MTEETAKPDRRRKRKAFAVAGTVVLLGLTALVAYRVYARTHVSTDDAFVEGSVHLVAPRVAGTVSEVLVIDNQAVKTDQVLVRLDPEPLQQAMAEAEASLRSEQARLAETQAQVTAQDKRVAAAKASLERTRNSEEELSAAVSARRAEVQARTASLDQARMDLSRAQKLADQEVIPRTRHDRARTAFEMESASLAAAEELRRQAEAALRSHKSNVAQAAAHLKAEEAALERARASLETQKEQIARRQAQADQARLRLSYTAVLAPADGFVTRMSAEVGNTVQAGQPLLSLVGLDDAHVVANYKETKIGRIRPGQKVTIRLDAYPGRKFRGTVDSLMAGTGSAFSLFPPENASGNYVKVVQRVPIKILFDDPEEVRPLLRVGMSVVPTILVK
ncbi:MAG: HlyD family secretion protein [bacterium]|nr:MAG: HlyD family secretion protein [bacterium]